MRSVIQMFESIIQSIKAALEATVEQIRQVFTSEEMTRLFDETVERLRAEVDNLTKSLDRPELHTPWECYRCRGCGRWYGTEAEAHRCEAGHRAVSERARRRGRGADCRCAGRRAGARAREGRLRSTELRRIRGA